MALDKWNDFNPTKTRNK